MLNGKLTDKQAILTMNGKDGSRLTLIAYLDGGYGILRNGEALDGHRWPDKELEACVNRLLRLAGEDIHFH